LRLAANEGRGLRFSHFVGGKTDDWKGKMIDIPSAPTPATCSIKIVVVFAFAVGYLAVTQLLAAAAGWLAEDDDDVVVVLFVER